MKTAYEYIHFRLVEEKTKTAVYACHNTRSGAELGVVQWHGPWRQYCFFPSGPAVYSAGCLADIEAFIGQLMEERRKA